MKKTRTVPPKATQPKPPPVLPEFTGRSKNDIIAELAKSPHGKLEVYGQLLDAAREDPEFFAHLVTWNAAKGEVKDARVALPIIGLRTAIRGVGHQVVSHGQDPEFAENALANLAGLDYRLFVRALQFGHTLFSREWRLAKRLVARRLKDLEADQGRWTRTAAQHRASLHYLYRRYRVNRPEFVARNIFEEERGVTGAADEKLLALPGTVFHAIQQLPKVTLEEAAGLILRHKIPFLTVKGALGKKATDPAVAFALIGAMTPTELLHNTKDLEKNYNIKRDPALRAAYEQALAKVSATSKGPSLKATRAAEVMEDIDEVLASKLKAVQEKQMEKLSIDGDWLVLGDKSSSMSHSIELAMETAATLARSVKGKVLLVFFNSEPRAFDVTGKTYDEVRQLCKHVRADGNTCIGIGLQYALENKIEVDGIVIVSDGGENHPPAFAHAYQKYAAQFKREPPVYFYRVKGDPNVLSRNCAATGVALTEFDITGGADYYSLPNLVKTMRVNRFSLMDEIMNLPLLKLDEVLTRTVGVDVIGKSMRAHA